MNDKKCICCDGTEMEQGAAIALTYLFDLGYDMPRDSYSEWLWNVRETILKQNEFRFKLPLKEIGR